MRSIFFLFLVSCSLCFAQTVAFKYEPKNKDSVITYINEISEKKIRKFGDSYKKAIRENILERKQNFIEKIEDSSFIYNAKVSNYLNTILEEIYKKNPLIDKKDFYFFVERSPIPNAACYGNGVFTINLGLFNFVHSDDELAFIICHEIAHYILEHNDKSLLNYFETINSNETKKKIKTVKKTEYGKRKAYSELMNDLSFNFLKRSQKVEVEADSLGLMIYKKTKYNIHASATSLQNLEFSDVAIFNEASRLQEHFNFENYPFKESWLLQDEKLFDITKNANDFLMEADSMKTHPAIPLRVKKLNALIAKNPKSKTDEIAAIDEIKKIAAAISIETFIDSNKIDLALYQCLIMFNKQLIDNKSYADIVSKLLKKTYELKEQHRFGNFVSPVYPFSDEIYLNEVKQFLINIELKNIRKIGLQFCIKHSDIMLDNQDFKRTKQFFTNLNQ